MASPEELTAIEKPPFFYRSRLVKIICIAAAAFAMLGILLNYGGGTKKKQPAAVETAPNVKVPDFGDYRGRAGTSAAPPEPDRSGFSYPAPPAQSRETALEQSPEYQEPVWAREVYAVPPPSSRGENRKTPEETARESPLVPALQGSLFSMPASSPPRQTAPPSGAAAALPPGGAYQMSPAASQAPSFSDILGNALASSGSASAYDNQNMQGNKQAFYPGNSGGGGQTVTGSFLGENTLWNGTVIPAVLITGINTDLPGDVQARVTQNVYDSKTGKKLLIPQGTILIASYNSSVSFAQSRVQIVWNTLIRPDGFTVSLDGMNAVDGEGYSGVKGQYRENLFQYAKAMGIVSLFSVLNGEVSRSTGIEDNRAYRDIIAANQNVVNQLGTKIIDKALDIQPTITVKNGTAVNIMLNKHLQLPPIDDYDVTAKYTRE